MSTREQIKAYLDTQPEPKRGEMRTLHSAIMKRMPKCKLWFLDGKDDKGKVVTNPNVGYGLLLMQYAGGKTREFYQVGMSGNTSGISIYIMGLKDKKYLAQTYARKLGKASVTGYCIKFKALGDIDIDVLGAAIEDGVAQTAV